MRGSLRLGSLLYRTYRAYCASMVNRHVPSRLSGFGNVVPADIIMKCPVAQEAEHFCLQEPSDLVTYAS